jgi:hypothetical protein
VEKKEEEEEDEDGVGWGEELGRIREERRAVFPWSPTDRS